MKEFDFVIEEDGSITTPFGYSLNPFMELEKLKKEIRKQANEEAENEIALRLEKLTEEQLYYFAGWFYQYEPNEIARTFLETMNGESFDDCLERFKAQAKPEKHGFGNFEI